jgi:hypothetical protein
MSALFERYGAAATTLAAFFAALATTGCELSEVVLSDVDDVVVAEVLVQVREGRPGLREPAVTALLHRTSGAPEGVPGARVVIRSPGRSTTLFQDADARPCAWSGPENYGITCYRSDIETFFPGEALQVEIDLPSGGRLEGSVRVPGDFRLLNGAPVPGGSPRGCRLDPERTFELRWSRSEGAWAYVAETALDGFRAGLAARGIDVDVNYLYLLGLASSASDTTIVFPSEFGLIERLNTERDLLVALQSGLPEGTQAHVSVAAVERNYTNWARGGAFNPSGQVRIPSLAGDGTGFFGAAVVRTLTLGVPPLPGGDQQLPACG